MTYRKFLLSLKSIPVKWYLQKDGHIRIRRRITSRCPITALCMAKLDAKLPTIEYEAAGKVLGLSKVIIERIANASDNLIEDEDKLKEKKTAKVRKDLLRVLDLQTT